jgi:exopolyphosphatase/guanosine-5'-triphosphate,3'-diphosphate pyrophosphatase
MEQRAYTRIGKDVTRGGGEISDEKLAEVIDVVCTQVRLAQELGAEAIRIVATAAIRKAANGEEVAAEIERAAGVPVDVLGDHEEGRLAFIGATKALGHPTEGDVAVVDVGGGSSEVTVGTIAGGVSQVHSFAIGSGALTEDVITGNPPGPGEIRKLRERIEEFFDGVDLEHPDQAVAVGGSATSLRRLVGAVLEYETLERGVRVLTGEPAAEVAKKFELDPRRVEVLAAGILLLEQFSQMLGQPLQIGKGGLREGVILEMLSDEAPSPAA